MDRRASALGASEAVVYERREVDPDAEELSRRTGSTRTAQYSQALGFSAPQRGSQVVLDDEMNLSGNWSVGFSAKVGDIVEASGEWTLFFAGSTADTDTDNSARCYLKRVGSDYKVHLDFIDSASTVESVTAISVTPGDDVDILITKNGTTVTLNVDAGTQSVVLAGSYTITAAQVELLGTHKIATRPKGTEPVLDNLHIWASVVTTSEYQDRTPTGSPFFSVLPSDIGGNLFEPATSTGKVFLHPAPPDVLSSQLHFSGFGGALRVPFRSLFERYFQTQTEIAGSQEFAFRVKGQRRFRSADTVLVDFGSDTEGFVYLTINASGNPVFKYNGTTVTSSATVSEDTDFDIFAGCDGTNLFLEVDGTPDTTAAPDAPYLDFQRIPDLYIGNDEDPAADKGFHGYLSSFQFYDYGARTATTTAAEPMLDLDFSGDEPRDKSVNRIALESLAHVTTEGRVLYAPGPLTDQSHQAVVQEAVVGPAAVGYTGKFGAPITSDASAVRAGDRAFVHSGDHVHVLNSELSQVRPLGIPLPGADVSCRAVGTGALDGAYEYGYRYRSQDGTYGPMTRLKPVAATGQSSVLVGAGTSGEGGSEDRRELGESYGLAEDGAAEHFTLTDSAGAIWTAIDGGADKELSVEAYLRFPDFDNLEESVFDRGSTANFSDETVWCCEPDQPIDLNPNGDFTMQLAFKFDRTVASGKTYASQGLLAIGHEDPDPTTRSFMVFLDEDSTYGTEDGAAPALPRLVVARSLGKKDGRYRYLIFNSSADEGADDNFWVDGQNYNLVVVRDGDDLRLHIHDQTNDTWKHFDGGACVGFFAGYDFPHQKLDFRATNVAFRKTGSSGNHYDEVANLPTANSGTNYTDAAGATGTHGYRDYGTSTAEGTRQATRLGWMDRGSTLYHARAWSRSWPKATIIYESEKRFAGRANGAMNDRIKSDVGFFSEDPSANPTKFWDSESSQFWRVYKADNDTSGIKNPSKGIATQVAGDPTEFPALMITDDGVAAYTSAQFRIYASSLGDGSIIVTTNEASYILPTKQWDGSAPAAYVKPLSDANIDPQQFNWFTCSVNFEATGSAAVDEAFELTVLDLDINGNRLFDAPLGNFGTDVDINGQDLIVYMGGGFGANDGDTEIGEFRLWNTNRYDDNNESYDYITGRVRNSERSNLYLYPTFEPADEVTSTTYNHQGSLSSDLLTLVNSASIVDTRDTNNQGEVTDPAPAVAIPKPPYPWLTAVELFRTIAYPINDPQDAGEVESALEAVRGQPAYFLARIPAGDSSFVDIATDDTLGFEAPEGGTGYLPARPNGVCIWQNQLAVFRDNTLHFSERGPFGWESYPAWATYAVPTSVSGGDIVAAAEIGASLLVCGKSWGTLLSGAPSQPRPFDMGGSAGVQSARALTVHGGMAYGLGKSKLWRASQGGEFDDSFSAPVHDLLPTQGRLSVSGALSSLLVIDEQSDLVLRYHFPTQQWSVEERDALGIGDQGDDYIVVHSASGAYSTGSTVYGDDVNALTESTSSGTVDSPTTVQINPDTDPQAPEGTRVLVVDSSGNEAIGTFSSYTSDTVTLAADLSGLSGTCTIYYGVGSTGMLVDTGWFAPGQRSADVGLLTDVTQGTFDFALGGTDQPGDRSDRSALTYADLGSAYESTGTGGRGRYVRAVVRNRTPSASTLGHAELEIKHEQ